MRARLYLLAWVLRRTLSGMSQAPMVQTLAILTISVCMLMLGSVSLMWINARGLEGSWNLDVPVTAYLSDAGSGLEVEELRGKLEIMREIRDVKVVDGVLAMARLEQGLGGGSSLLEGVSPETLPTSLELTLAPGVPSAFAGELARSLESLDSIEEVATLGPWSARAEEMFRTLEQLGSAIAVLVTLACLTIVWNTIRLSVFARRDEIRIVRLVGGTSAAVRGPFVVEGMIQGLFGAGLALLLLERGFEALVPYLGQGLLLVASGGTLRFFLPVELVVFLAFGIMLGFVGSRAAVGRYAAM